MVLPIITSISREVFAQTPTAHKEGALALGATRWEMIRTAVLPFGRPGLISAAMLGLGRALGETIAVMILLSASSAVRPSPPRFCRRRDLRVEDRANASRVQHRAEPAPTSPRAWCCSSSPSWSTRSPGSSSSAGRPSPNEHHRSRDGVHAGARDPRGPADADGRSPGRALRNTLATVGHVVGVRAGVVPLVWILGTVRQGRHAAADSSWWFNPNGASPSPGRRRRLPRAHRFARDRPLCRVIAVPLGVFDASTWSSTAAGGSRGRPRSWSTS